MLIFNPFLMGMLNPQETGFDSLTIAVAMVDDLPGFEDIHGSELFAKQAPAFSIDIFGPEEAKIGDDIIFIITIRNDRENGNGSPIRDVTLLDELGKSFVFIDGDVNNNNLLEVNESWRYERAMRIQLDDTDQIYLTAVASGKDEDGNPVNQIKSTQVVVEFNPHIDLLLKSSNSGTIGETVTFQITVTNQILTQEIGKFNFSNFSKYQFKTPSNISRFIKKITQRQGSGTIFGYNQENLIKTTGIIIVASLLGYTIAWIITTLRPTTQRGIVVFCVVIAIISGVGYSGITQGWMDDLVDNAQPITPTDLTPTPKQSRDDDRRVISIGDGSSVEEISISSTEDIKLNYLGGDSDEDDILDFGENWLYSFSYTIQRNDPDILFYPIVVTGLDRDGDLISLESSLTLEVVFKPMIEIIKTGPNEVKFGEQVTYGFIITNDSSRGDGSPVSQIAVRDGVAGFANFVSGDIDEDSLLEVGERWNYTVTHTFLANDTDQLDRFVIVTGQDPDGQLLSYHQSYNLNFGTNPAIKITTIGPESVNLGEKISIAIKVSNDDDVGDGSSINNIIVSDNMTVEAKYRSGDLDGDGVLVIGEQWIFDLDYSVQGFDPETIYPTFTVSGNDLDGDLVQAEYPYLLEVNYSPSLSIQIEGLDSAKVGDQTTTQIYLKHAPGISDGSPVKEVVVYDHHGNPLSMIIGDSNQNGQLDFEEEWLYETTFAILPTDPVDLVQTIQVSGSDLDGDLVLSETSHTLIVDFNPSISINTTGPDTVATNEMITFDVILTNDIELGDGSPVSEPTLTDNLFGSTAYISGDHNGDNNLDEGENWIYSYSFTVQENDPDPIVITLVVSGLDQNSKQIDQENTFRIQKVSPLTNGNFELQDVGWNFQDNGLSASTIRMTPTEDEDIPLDSIGAILGRTEYPCSPEGVPIGYAEIRQTFYVPDAPDGQTVSLSFNYVIYTQDTSTKPEYDRFEVFINDSASPVFSDGNQVNSGLGCNIWWRVPGPGNIRDEQTSGWAIGIIDLEGFQGQTIIVSFQNHNRFDGWYNTYTYLDDIKIVVTDIP
jgi:hypothetical protein